MYIEVMETPHGYPDQYQEGRNEMVTAATVKSLADRLTKAEALVAEGSVFPVSGCAGYAMVRNGGGDSMYLVRFDAGHENCTCPDFKQRQEAAGLPCKHLMAAQLAHGEVAPVEIKRPDPAVGLAIITGKAA